MFIKLTTCKEDYVPEKSVYLNPLTITSIWEDISYTHIGTVDGGWYVKETPEEIMKMVDDKLSINKIVFK